MAEFATQFFITDNKCNCAGLVLAGSAEFKNELQVSAFPRRSQRSRGFTPVPVHPCIFVHYDYLVLDAAGNSDTNVRTYVFMHMVVIGSVTCRVGFIFCGTPLFLLMRLLTVHVFFLCARRWRQGSDLFDPRLLKNVIKMVDVSYGGEAGFNQAIELSAETLGSVKLVQVCEA